MKKVLVVRFSSIGDVVLTTPVVRALNEQVPGVAVHFVTRETFRSLLEPNPRISRVHSYKKDITEIIGELKAEKFDAVIDLHKNLRSLRLKQKLGVRSFSFDKINLRKFLAVNLKLLKILPDKHIVDRYFDGLSPLGLKQDNKGLEFYIKNEDEIDCAAFFFAGRPGVRFIALVVGGSYYTKKIPVSKLREICSLAQLPVILLGGKEDKVTADQLQSEFPGLYNTCGNFNFGQSASVLKQAEWVITSDTGMMHIAAAFNKKIISAWGNTIPEFGMYPYGPHAENKILEIKDLNCRPCSKLGYARCPLGHFRCMNDISFSFVGELK